MRVGLEMMTCENIHTYIHTYIYIYLRHTVIESTMRFIGGSCGSFSLLGFGFSVFGFGVGSVLSAVFLFLFFFLLLHIYSVLYIISL